MRLPKFLGDKIMGYWEDIESRYWWMYIDAGQPGRHSVDDNEDLYWSLKFCFNEELEVDGRTTYLTTDWGEIYATLWLPAHKWWKLCKIGWHSFFTSNGKPLCIHCKYGR